MSNRFFCSLIEDINSEIEGIDSEISVVVINDASSQQIIDKYPNTSFEVCGRFMRRGGIDINPIRSNKKSLIFKNFRVFNQ